LSSLLDSSLLVHHFLQLLSLSVLALGRLDLAARFCFDWRFSVQFFLKFAGEFQI
jgi:hypothetical protein